MDVFLRFHKHTQKMFCKIDAFLQFLKIVGDNWKSDQNPNKIPYERICLQWSCRFPGFNTTKSKFHYIYFSGFCQLVRYTYFKECIFMATSTINLLLLSCKRVSKILGLLGKFPNISPKSLILTMNKHKTLLFLRNYSQFSIILQQNFSIHSYHKLHFQRKTLPETRPRITSMKGLLLRALLLCWDLQKQLSRLLFNSDPW